MYQSALSRPRNPAWRIRPGICPRSARTSRVAPPRQVRRSQDTNAGSTWVSVPARHTACSARTFTVMDGCGIGSSVPGGPSGSGSGSTGGGSIGGATTGKVLRLSDPLTATPP